MKIFYTFFFTLVLFPPFLLLPQSSYFYKSVFADDFDNLIFTIDTTDGMHISGYYRKQKLIEKAIQMNPKHPAGYFYKLKLHINRLSSDFTTQKYLAEKLLSVAKRYDSVNDVHRYHTLPNYMYINNALLYLALTKFNYKHYDPAGVIKLYNQIIADSIEMAYARYLLLADALNSLNYNGFIPVPFSDDALNPDSFEGVFFLYKKSTLVKSSSKIKVWVAKLDIDFPDESQSYSGNLFGKKVPSSYYQIIKDNNYFYELYEYEFLRGKNKILLLTWVSYDKEGNVRNSFRYSNEDYESVVPGSLGEQLYDYFCNGRIVKTKPHFPLND